MSKARFFRVLYQIWDVNSIPEERLAFWVNIQEADSCILDLEVPIRKKVEMLENLYFASQKLSGTRDQVKQNLIVEKFYKENGVTLKEIQHLLHFWEFTPLWQQFREDHPSIVLLPMWERLRCYEQRFIIAEAEIEAFKSVS